jgi:hypothetical protein
MDNLIYLRCEAMHMEFFKNKYNYVIEMKLRMKRIGKLVSKNKIKNLSSAPIKVYKVIFTICITMKPSPRLSINCWSSNT